MSQETSWRSDTASCFLFLVIVTHIHYFLGDLLKCECVALTLRSMPADMTAEPSVILQTFN